MRYEEVLAIPTGAVVEFVVMGDERKWTGWLASMPIEVVCEGGADPHHGCLWEHIEPLASYGVDIQIVSSDWPYEDPHPEYGRDFALVPIENVVRMLDLPPEWFTSHGVV